MSRALLLLLLAALLPAAHLRAQSLDSMPTSALVARLADIERRMGVSADGRVSRPASALPAVRTQVVGRITMVVLAAVPRSAVDSVATFADSALAEFGAIPADFVGGLLLADEQVPPFHPALSESSLHGRTMVRMPWGRATDAGIGRGRRVSEPIAGAFWATLDRRWKQWLPYHLGIDWSPRLNGEESLNDLAGPTASMTGKQCLAGDIRGCRLWLGLDDDSASVTSRYAPAEMQESALRVNQGDVDVRECVGGDRASCARAFLGHRLYMLPWIPAPDRLRATMLRELSARHGLGAMRRALADTSGTVGARLARAAGVSQDSLITEWRMWVLARGRSDRVEAGFGEFASVLIFLSALLALALRSGRCR
jgi:hypothetical protein